MSVAVAGLVSWYEVNALDSNYAAREATARELTATPAAGTRLVFGATAYCKGNTTTSGVAVQTGIAAADPALLPVGSVIGIEGLAKKYDGVYTVLDTGPSVHGRHVDLYMWSCYEAQAFGHQQTRLTVMRLGWSPRQSTPPTFLDRLFKRPAPPLPD